MLFVLLALRSIIKQPSFEEEPPFKIHYKGSKQVENKINWKKFWKGLKIAFRVITTIVKIVLIFLDDDGSLYINGYKVTNVIVGEDGRPKEVTLVNGANKFVINADIKELKSEEFSWAKFWEGIKKLLDYISNLFQTQELALEDDEATFGDYTVTDVTLNDNDVAEDITLESPSGNKIIFHIEIGATNEETDDQINELRKITKMIFH